MFAACNNIARLSARPGATVAQRVRSSRVAGRCELAAHATGLAQPRGAREDLPCGKLFQDPAALCLPEAPPRLPLRIA